MPARHPVLVAVPEPWEGTLVATLSSGPTLAVIRRCADLAEAVAVAGSGRVVGAFVSPDLPGLDADAVTRLNQDGVSVVGVLPPGGHRTDLGPLVSAVAADASVETCEEALHRATPRVSAHALADPAQALRTRPEPQPQPRAGTGTGGGRVVAVWGPAGSPGRTSVAVGLADELGMTTPALLVDADTYGPSIAQVLGVLDEAPGLVAACRAAGAGVLDPVELSRRAPFVGTTLRVLTGLTRTDRWPELTAQGLEEVFRVARHLVDWTVVDTGFCLEQDEELSYDTLAPRRNAATLTALAQADVVVAVGAADPLGMQRLLAGLEQLRATFEQVSPVIVLTRVRAAAVGADPKGQLTESLRRFAGIDEVVLVPDDRPAYDAALLTGRTIAEQAPRSPVLDALAELADGLHARSRARTTPTLAPAGTWPADGPDP